MPLLQEQNKGAFFIMGTIETIFENYKASYNEETSLSEGQDTAMSELEKATLINPASGQTAFDKAIALSSIIQFN